MALTLTERARLDIGGAAFRAYDVTADGSTTTITAASLDLTSIESIMIAPKAPLYDTSATADIGNITDGNEEAIGFNFTGSILGDFARGSYAVDLTYLQLDAQVTAGGSMTVGVASSYDTAINVAAGTLKTEIPKYIGFSQLTGDHVIFGPHLQSGDVFTIWVIGF